MQPQEAFGFGEGINVGMRVLPDVFWTRISPVITIVRMFKTRFLMMMAPDMIMRTAVYATLVFNLYADTASPVIAQLTEAVNSRGTLFQQEPDTPARLVRAADAAARLQRPLLARGYLQALEDRGLPDEALLQLRDDVGVQTFLSLNANIDLQPLAGELLNRVNQATSSATLSPERAESLVAQLGENGEPSEQAAVQLLTIGAPMVPAILEFNPHSKSGRVGRQLIHQNARPLRLELLAALKYSEAEDQLWILKLLKAASDPTLAPELLRYEFTAHSAVVRNAARQAIDELWSDSGRPGTADKAVEWLSRQAQRFLADASDRFTSESSRDKLNQAVRFAEVAVELDSANDFANGLLLACRSAVDADVGGTLGEDARSEALELAIQAGNSAAALVLMGSDPGSLRRSMQLPGPAVRLQAAVRLTGLNRRVRGLPLAHRIIRDAANGSSSPEAVVIDPRQDVAILAAYLLGDQGYQAVRTLTGQAGFEQAIRQLNCDLILIHSNCLRWPLSQTVANLRADSRTRQTPIAVYGPPRDAASIHALQDRYPGISYLPGPLSEINFVEELRRNDVPGPSLTESVRSQLIQQAKAAIEL